MQIRNGSLLRRASATALAVLAVLFAAPAAQAVNFEGQTVNIIVNFDAGSGTDAAARQIAPFVARHLPGKPNIIVTNKPGATGLAAVEYFIDSVPPNGMNIGYFAGTISRWTFGQKLPEGTTDLSFVVARSVNSIILARTEKGLNPDTVAGYPDPLFFGEVSADNHIMMRMSLFMKAVGAKEYHALSGYRGQGAQVGAMRSDELDMTMVSDTFLGSGRDAIPGDGKIVAFGQMGAFVDGSFQPMVGWEDIPVLDAMWRKISPETVDSADYTAWKNINIAMAMQQVFLLPPNTPEDIAIAWEQAILAAFDDPDYKALLASDGLPPPAVMGRDAIKQNMREVRDSFETPEIKEALRLAIERNERG